MGAADPRLSETVDKNVFDFSPIHLTKKESDSIPRTTCLVGLVKVTAPGGNVGGVSGRKCGPWQKCRTAKRVGGALPGQGSSFRIDWASILIFARHRSMSIPRISVKSARFSVSSLVKWQH